MCRRFQLKDEDKDSLKEYSGETPVSALDVTVGKKAPAILLSAQDLKIENMTFGLPSFDKPFYNARLETVLNKPSFRESFLKRRCLLPCSDFFEQDKYHQEHLFYAEELMYLAGIYENHCFCLLTEKGNEEVGFFHPRMPVVLTKKDIQVYLDIHTMPKDILSLPTPKLNSPSFGDQLSLF